MDLIHIGGYFGDVISVAVVAFLVLLAAFIALNVIIACRYHSTKHAFAEEARRLQGRVATHRRTAPMTTCSRHASGAIPATTGSITPGRPPGSGPGRWR